MGTHRCCSLDGTPQGDLRFCLLLETAEIRRGSAYALHKPVLCHSIVTRMVQGSGPLVQVR